MKYILNYGNSVSAIPGAAMKVIDRASAIDLRVLLCVAANGGDVDPKKLEELALGSENQVREALSFWRGAGVISFADEESKDKKKNAKEDTKPSAPEKKEEKKPETRLKSVAELPKYNSDELAGILESRNETATLIDECQCIMGKVFSIREIGILVGLLDFLGLDCEYIMILLTYCVSIGKKTLHYVEKTAFELYDSGITTGEQLSEELTRRERANAVEGKIRALFGIGARAFTTKEKKFISAWINDMKYSFEIIERAYEVTADATGKGAFPYANTILERWNAEGLRTLEDIERSYIKAEEEKKEGKKGEKGSFETDSFFEAAVRRSLGE